MHDPRYPGYTFLKDGSVYAHKAKKFLKLQKDKDNYAIVGVTRADGTRTTIRVHRVIATLFIPNEDNKPFVNHKNGDKFDNKTTNLEWCTAKENTHHAIEHGLIRYRGVDNPVSKLTESEIHRIRSIYATGLMKQAEIAKAFGVTQGMVGSITRKESWSHI